MSKHLHGVGPLSKIFPVKLSVRLFHHIAYLIIVFELPYYNSSTIKKKCRALFSPLLCCKASHSTLYAAYSPIHCEFLYFFLWGHSSTTWIKSYPILTPYPHRVDNCGHFTYYLPFDHVTKSGLSTNHLLVLPSTSLSSCPRSYWMTPFTE